MVEEFGNVKWACDLLLIADAPLEAHANGTAQRQLLTAGEYQERVTASFGPGYLDKSFRWQIPTGGDPRTS